MTTSTKENDYSDQNATGVAVVTDPETGLPVVPSEEEKNFTTQGEECTGSCVEKKPGE